MEQLESRWTPVGLQMILDKKLAGLPPKKKCLNSTVLYTPTACPTDSDGLSLDPAISNGLSGQSVRSLSESVGHDWILLIVWPKSSESPLKPLRSKKWLDWPEFCVCWTSTGLPLDFRWISDGLRQKPVIFAKFTVHWTSAGLPPDF